LNKPLCLIATLTLALAGARVAHAGLLDLGTLGGATSQAFGIRPDGTVVVGSSLNASAQTQAFAWTANANFTGGSMTALNFLSGGTLAEARAINASGLVVGYSRDSSAIDQAVTWSGTNPTLLSNTLGGSGARAFGVSTAGDVVGWARQSGGVQRAFVSVSGSMSALDLSNINAQHSVSVGHNARALGVSPNGRYVVGEYEVDNGAGGIETRGFVYDRTTPANSYEFSAGGVGSAIATNNTHAVGTVTNPPDPLAAFSSHSTGSSNFFPQLAGGAGAANAINAAGFAVGSETVAGLGQRALLWNSPSTGATVTDMNTLHSTGNVLNVATGIADTPDFYTGWGTFGGNQRAFLLALGAATVPEPGTIALLTIGGIGGLGGLVARRRSRRGKLL
jgi:probable HAF family extracellular repeat protein